MNTAWAGGSSSVFSNALNALVESICTSSIIYTLYLALEGANRTFSIISRISSTRELEAASNSITSVFEPSVILLQVSHVLQGSFAGPFSQFKAFANIFAALV